MHKYLKCLFVFYRFLESLPSKKVPERFGWIQLPKKPRQQLEEAMPTQLQIKQFIEAVYEEGKRFSIRDQAIFALLNDSGARISEALSIRNKHIFEENNYLVVSFPESKTTPRTVISYLAKPFLEKWAKVSPNRGAGPDAFFFCQKNGAPCTYAAIMKSFKRALAETKIPWKKGKSVHYFRSLCSSRFFEWPYTLKHAWFGWSFKDHEAVYTKINYKQFTDIYFQTLKKEQNPFLREDSPFWSEDNLDEAVLEKLLEKEEFKAMIKKLVRQTRPGFE